MQSENALTKEIGTIVLLRDLVKVYEEIYMLKMKNTKDSVLANRRFYDGVSAIFEELRASYMLNLKSYKKGGGRVKYTSSIKKEKDSVAIFISGNRKFSGDINRRVFAKLMNYVAGAKPDLVIVGKIGRDLYKQRGLIRPFKYFDITEDNPKAEEVSPIVKYIIEYKSVDVFYGRFISFMRQAEAETNISSAQSADLGNEKELSEQTLSRFKSYLFEPSLDEILIFFETQIFASLFKHTLYESSLAQIGARVQVLEGSAGNIEKRLSDLNFERLKMLKEKKNKKQMQTLSGYMFWS